MPDLRLPKLPARTANKVTFNIEPSLLCELEAYARAYEQSYGQKESLTKLIPAMLTSFIESDRLFVRSRRSRGAKHRE